MMLMDDPGRGPLDHCPQARAQWVHDLRNSMSVAGASATLARRMLAQGNHDGALEMLARCENAWNECRALLASAGTATSMGADAPGQPVGRSRAMAASTAPGSIGFTQTSTSRNLSGTSPGS